MKKRGQKVNLKHNETGQLVKAKVVLADSRQGYLAEEVSKPDKVFLDAWKWYNLNEWSEVK